MVLTLTNKNKIINIAYFIIAISGLSLSCFFQMESFNTANIFLFFILLLATAVTYVFFLKNKHVFLKFSDIIVSLILLLIFLILSGIFSNVFLLKNISLSIIFLCSAMLVAELINLIVLKIQHKYKNGAKIVLGIGTVYSILLSIISIINIFTPVIKTN